MKTRPSRTQSRGTAARNARAARQGSSTGRWSFNLASEHLFVLGSTDTVRRAAYRTSDGRIRFLPQ